MSLPDNILLLFILIFLTFDFVIPEQTVLIGDTLVFLFNIILLLLELYILLLILLFNDSLYFLYVLTSISLYVKFLSGEMFLKLFSNTLLF